MAGERAGIDQHAAAGDLFAAHPGEQPGPLDVDTDVDERRGQMLGEVLQVVGHVLTGGGGQIQVVDLVDQNEVDPGFGHGLADRVGDVGRVVAALGHRQAEETGELGGQFARRALRRGGHIDHRDPACAGMPLPDHQLVGAAELFERGGLAGGLQAGHDQPPAGADLPPVDQREQP